ncbi:DUF6542 domain-containing protein [Streptomyces sp. NPDC058284]|uniref:DUF6542 domain-containing protein n=1 Tax=unclassified Streptomyces TaxID=2593676 RepID=UPI00366237F6
MEQHRTRPPQSAPRSTSPARPRRTTAPLPPQGRPAASRTVYRAAPRPRRPAPPFVRALRRTPLYRTLRRIPNPRLTGLGSGLFCTAVMFLLACLLWLVGGSVVAYGVLFLPVAALTALWVRPADLVTAPVGVPIAFAAGVLPISEGSGGFGGQLIGLVTTLAFHAGWLYGGTLVAGLIVIVRRVQLMTERRRTGPQQKQQPPAPPPPGGKRLPVA